jgi:hypothetical protein
MHVLYFHATAEGAGRMAVSYVTLWLETYTEFSFQQGLESSIHGKSSFLIPWW